MSAPRKTAPRKLAAATTPDKPAPVALNLDTLEREGAPEPFVLVLGGQRYAMVDAMELDYQDLASAQADPVSFIRMVIAEDQRDKFFANRMTVWQINKLMAAYMEHHGMPVPGELNALLT